MVSLPLGPLFYYCAAVLAVTKRKKLNLWNKGKIRR